MHQEDIDVPDEPLLEDDPEVCPDDEEAALPQVDPDAWEYADFTEKTGWQNRCAMLIGLYSMRRWNELERVMQKFAQHENMWRQLLYLNSAIQRFGDKGPQKLGYKW